MNSIASGLRWSVIGLLCLLPSSALHGQAAAPAPPPAVAAPPGVDAADAVVRHRMVRVDGIDLFYREAGPAHAPAILLLHGFPASSFMYRDLIGRLGARYRVVAPDYPGFGYSAAPSVDRFGYTFEHLAGIVDKFTQQVGLNRYAIYMQDFGGPVGLRLAAKHPGRVTALVIQNANAYEEGLPDGFWRGMRELWADPSAANMARMRDIALADATIKWNYTHGVKDSAAVSPDSWALQSALMNRPGTKDIMMALLVDYRSNLGQYATWQRYFRKHQPPALIVWGQNDFIFPVPGARAYLKDLPKAQLHLLDTGHFALEDKSEEIARLMASFLDRATARAG